MSKLNDLFFGFKKGFKNFEEGITSMINTILLFFAYLIGVGIISIIAKITKKHFLDLKKKETKSYWKKIKFEKKSFEKYYRQFWFALVK